MPPRPIYRWKSFWLGILILGLLGWAWGLSERRLDHLSWRPFRNDFIVFLDHANGWIMGIGCEDPYSEEGSSSYAFPGDLGPRRNLVFEKLEDGGTRVGIAHWILMVLFLVPWLGFLAWRWRKIRLPGNTGSAA